jgi:hypothetical protein
VIKHPGEKVWGERLSAMFGKNQDCNERKNKKIGSLLCKFNAVWEVKSVKNR